MFGRAITIRKEYRIIGVFVLLILLTLWGWYLKTSQAEVFTAIDEPDSTEASEALVKAAESSAVESEDTVGWKPEEDIVLEQKSELIGNELININTADLDTLITLYGIGEVKAAAIVEYRRQNGPFQSIEEIQKVKGIGEITFGKNKDRITVGTEQSEEKTGTVGVSGTENE